MYLHTIIKTVLGMFRLFCFSILMSHNSLFENIGSTTTVKRVENPAQEARYFLFYHCKTNLKIIIKRQTTELCG